MDDVLAIVLFLVIHLVIYTGSLWIAAKLIGDEGRFVEFGIIALVATAVAFVPGVGGILSLVVFFGLLWKLMDIDFVKAVIICVLAFTIRFGAFRLLDNFLRE